MTLNGEEWRDVVGYEGVYEVSNLGNVRSVDRTKVCRNGVIKLIHGVKLSLVSNSGNGYLEVLLRNSGNDKRKGAHRLVAESFIPNPKNLSSVDHINGDKHDNRVENLRWVSPKENTRYAIELGLFDPDELGKNLRSEKCVSAKLKANRKQIRRSDGVVFGSLIEAARKMGVSKAAISHVLNGRSKSCRGFTFSYVAKEA